MLNRAPLLSEFLTRLERAFQAAPMQAEATASIAKVFAALGKPSPGSGEKSQRQPVCAHLGDALTTARTGSEPIARLADALQALEP